MSFRNFLNTKRLLPILPEMRKILYTFIILFIFYSVVTLVGMELYERNYPNFFSLSTWAVIVAILTCLLYFIIDGIIKKSKGNAILPSIQVFLFFSALPYIIDFPIRVSNAQFYLSIFGMILFYFIMILPEIFGFAGVVYLRKKSKLPGIIFLALAILIGIEIFPIRSVFRFDSTEVIYRINDPEYMKPFCTDDREFEFKRSIETIENLVLYSQDLPDENLRTVKLNIPNLELRPDMLKLGTDWEWMPYQYWDDFDNPAFIEKIVKLDMVLDSDEDGLSDFREAKLLSDAYNKETDNDGVTDGKDSDPLNPLIESEIAPLNAAIIEYWMSDLWYADGENSYFCEVINWFYEGRGEIANFNKHVLLIAGDHRFLWYRIFEPQHDLGPPDIKIGRPLFDYTGRIAVVDISCSSAGGLLFLLKWHGKWKVIAWRGIWIS